MYSIPHISSLNKEIYKFKQPDIIDFEIYVEFTEIDAEKYKKYLFECLKKYENVFSRYGYIVEIQEILDYSDMIVSPFYFENKMKVIVKAKCFVFDIKVNAILVNCKLIDLKNNKALFKYKNSIFVYVDNVTNLVSSDFKKRYNLRIVKILNKYIYTDPFAFYIKKNDRIRRVDIKNILTDIGINEYKTIENIDVILSDGSKKTFKTKKIEKIYINHQAFYQGQIENLWNIPMRFRFVKYSSKTNTDPITKFNIKYTKDGNSLVRKFYPTRKYEKYSDLSKELHFLGQNKKETIPDTKLLWNFFLKYYINPYEMLNPAKTYRQFKSNKIHDRYHISEPPVSRAYFKMFEILHVFNLIKPIQKNQNLNFLSIGDAPGGFAQCLSHIFPKSKVKTVSLNDSNKTRKKLGLSLDETIISYKPIIKSNKNIFIEYMKDETGDLLDVDNILYMSKKYPHTMDLVAGDGALSYYELYLLGISKESQHTRLLLCEIIISLICLKLHGSFCVKLYGRYTEVTVQIMMWLSEMFESVYLYKLKSIRITNNETFLVCTNYKTKFNSLDNILNELKKISFDSFIISITDKKINNSLITKLNNYNVGLDKVKIFTHELGYEIYLEEHKFDYSRKPSVYAEQWNYALNKFINNTVD